MRGLSYVNVLTLRNHLGELRGQIIPLAQISTEAGPRPTRGPAS
jgi:hypothetical protein